MLNFKTLSIMKTRLLKITLSFAMLFIAAGAFAQDEQLEDAAGVLPELSEDTDGSAVDHVTEGYTVPYFVKPDPVLNSFTEPYDISDDSDQGFSSEWVWDFNTNNTEGTGSATAAITVGGSSNNHPYAEVEWTRSAGATEGQGETAFIEVQEQSQSGLSCAGDWKWLEVQVYAEPEFTFINGADGGIQDTDGSNQQPGGTTIELCDDGSGVTKDILIASIIDNGIPDEAGDVFENGNFKFRLDRDVYIVDESGAEETMVSETIDEIVTLGLNFGNGVVLFGGEDLSAIDNSGDGSRQITRYRFDFGSTISAANANGITDPVQRKSQYLTNSGGDDTAWDYIANTNEGNPDMLTVITYPAPNTGNIHYVPNNFDL